MKTLKFSFILLGITINSICSAMTVECSICHENFQSGTKNSSTTVCANCNQLIKAIQEWKQYCPDCRKLTFLDLCQTCLTSINTDPCGACSAPYTTYIRCLACLNKHLPTKKQCLYTGCHNDIAIKGCCGYFSRLCSNHNTILIDTITTRKKKCNACKKQPLLDLCPACLESINADHCDDCQWKDTVYGPYVPCIQCLEKHTIE